MRLGFCLKSTRIKLFFLHLPLMTPKRMMGKSIMRNLRMTVIRNTEGSLTKNNQRTYKIKGLIWEKHGNKTSQKGMNQNIEETPAQDLGSLTDASQEKMEVTQKVMSASMGNQDKGSLNPMDKGQHVDHGFV
jgi:hypothetical protein